MTFRPDPELQDNLRRQADLEGRPQAAIISDALRQYLERTARKAHITQVSKRGADRYREALDRLGSA